MQSIFRWVRRLTQLIIRVGRFELPELGMGGRGWLERGGVLGRRERVA